MNTGNAENGNDLESDNSLGLGINSPSKPEFDMDISHAVAGAAGRVLKNNEIRPDAVKWDGLQKIASNFQLLTGIIKTFDVKKDIGLLPNYQARTRLKDAFWRIGNMMQNTFNGVSDLGEDVGSYVMAPMYFIMRELKQSIDLMNHLLAIKVMGDDEIAKSKAEYKKYNDFCKSYLFELNQVLNVVGDPFNKQENFDYVVIEALFDALKIPSVPHGVISKYSSQDADNIDEKDFQETYDESYQAEFERDEKTLKLKIKKEREILQTELNVAKKENPHSQQVGTLKKKMDYWENTTPDKELKKAFRWRNFERLSGPNAFISLELFHKIWNEMKYMPKQKKQK